MSWFSILPPQLATLETWLIRFFLLLAFLSIGPWLLFIIYDFLLYVFRTFLHEVPYFGGRAHGERRPPIPSLSERPDGRPRRVSLVGRAISPEGGTEKSLSPIRRSGIGEIEEEEEGAITIADIDQSAKREGATRRYAAGDGPGQQEL
ncbi:hypothetical protein MMC10_002087 [Thelotrema lepadinum]|nr:hypothetical protein [Thelotrema lepadinum]